jgi:hypothetical protein
MGETIVKRGIVGERKALPDYDIKMTDYGSKLLKNRSI